MTCAVKLSHNEHIFKNEVFLLLHFLLKTFKMMYVRWPRELNALQLQKTHANRKSTSKSRKHFHHFDSRWCKCSQHKQIKKHTANAYNTTKYNIFAGRFFVWLCCEHLQRVRCQIDKRFFLICRCFFLFAARFFFLGCVMSICSVCVVKLTQVFT